MTSPSLLEQRLKIAHVRETYKISTIIDVYQEQKTLLGCTRYPHCDLLFAGRFLEGMDTMRVLEFIMKAEVSGCRYLLAAHHKGVNNDRRRPHPDINPNKAVYSASPDPFERVCRMDLCARPFNLDEPLEQWETGSLFKIND